MEKTQQILGQLPMTVIADAGYGSEENYAYLEKKEIQAVVKYGSYHKEKSKAWKANVGKIENWTSNTAEDHWTCPAGNMLHFHRGSKLQWTKNRKQRFSNNGRIAAFLTFEAFEKFENLTRQ